MSNRIKDFRKLSTSGESLYLTLGVQKASTVQEIKKAYKKLKLELLSDKSSKTVEENSKKINDVNRAHGILSDRVKKEIYDSNGSLGLYLVENFGDSEPDPNAFCVVASGWCVAVVVLCGSVLYSLFTCFCCCGFCCDKGCDTWSSSPDQGQDLVDMSAITVQIGEEKK